MSLIVSPDLLKMAQRRFAKSGEHFFHAFKRAWEDAVKTQYYIAKHSEMYPEMHTITPLTQNNLCIYFRYKAGMLVRPKKRGGSTLYERGQAIEKDRLAGFVFDVLLLDAALDSVLTTAGEAQSRAEECDHWASEGGDRLAMWEDRGRALDSMQTNCEWDTLVEACKDLDWEGIQANGMPELECS